MLGEKNELGKFNTLTKLGELFKKTFGEVEKYVDFIKDVIQGVPPEDIKEPAKAFLYQVMKFKMNCTLLESLFNACLITYHFSLFL